MNWYAEDGDPLSDLLNAKKMMEEEYRMVIETGLEEYQERARGAVRDVVEDLSKEEAARFLLTKTTGLANDKHGAKTPERFVRMLEELTTPEPFEFTTFANEEGVDEIVTVQNIPFVSLCNHHVVPFVGFAHIGYIPGAELVGLSKFARVVRHYAKALQVQERLTQQIAEFLQENLQPRGVAVIIQAEHMCMTIRGVQTPGTMTTTSSMKGVFADHDRTAKDEFLRLIGK